MKRDIRISLSVLLVGVVASGCSGVERGDSPGGAESQPAAGTQSVVTSLPGAVDEALAAEGEGLFQAKGCIGCHRVGGGRLVGPDLAGLAQRRTESWILAMIMNPDSMIRDDDTARDMLAEYFTPMPNQHLTEDDARALFEYMRRESQ